MPRHTAAEADGWTLLHRQQPWRSMCCPCAFPLLRALGALLSPPLPPARWIESDGLAVGGLGSRHCRCRANDHMNHECPRMLAAAGKVPN